MNNSKWIRFPDVLNDWQQHTPDVLVKLVTEHEPSPLSMEGKTRDFDCWQTGVEGSLAGQPRGWSFDIEWEWLGVQAATSESVEELIQTVESITHLDITAVDNASHDLTVISQLSAATGLGFVTACGTETMSRRGEWYDGTVDIVPLKELSMNVPIPSSSQRELQFENGTAIGTSQRWHKGQYCSILTPAGIVGCGIYDLKTPEEFGQAIAIAKGTPENPLVEPEDLFEAKIVGVTAQAAAMGIRVGDSGRSAVETMLANGPESAE